MVKVTTTALEALESYVRRKRVAPYVRIDVVTLCSHWQSLALRMDRSRSSDQAYQYGNLTFLVSRSLLLRCGEITVDYEPLEEMPIEGLQQGGFSISTARSLAELQSTTKGAPEQYPLVN